MRTRYLLLLFLAYAPISRAAFYYVDAAGGSDLYQKYQAQKFYYPWRHIQTGVDSAAAGDTLWVSGGVYLEDVIITTPIVILGEGHENTTIRPPAELGGGPVVTIADGVDNVFITQITIDGNRSGAFGAVDGIRCGIGVDGLYLRGVTVRNCIGSGITTTFDASVDGNINDGFILDSCVFVNILGGRSGNLPSCAISADHVSHFRCIHSTIANTGIGVWLTGTAFPDTSAGTGITLRNLVVQDVLQNAIVGQSVSNLTIDNCIFRRCAKFAVPESAWSASLPGTVCLVGQSVNVNFNHNIVRDNRGGLAAKSFFTNPATGELEGPGYNGWPAIFLGGDAGAVVRFNTIFNNGYGGIFVSGAGVYTITDNYIYSNGELNPADADYGLAAPLATVAAGKNWWGLDYGPGYDGTGLNNGVYGDGVDLTTGGLHGLTGRNGFDLRYVPQRVIYNVVHIGSHQDSTIMVYNNGFGPAFTAAPYISGASSQFEVVSPTAGQILNPGDSVLLVVRFAPTELGLLLAHAVVAPDTSGAPEGSALYGFGGLPVLTALDTIRFDTLIPGRCFERLLTIHNTGTEDLAITNATMLGADSSEFQVVEPMPIYLSSDQRAALHIRFCPTHVGSKVARITFTANTQPIVTIVELRGASAITSRFVAFPTTINLGLFRLEDRRDTAVSVRNTATKYLAIDSMRFENDTLHEFSFLTVFPDTIAPGTVAKVHMRFTPVSRGLKTVTLRGTVSDGTEFTITVTGGGGVFELTELPRTLFAGTVTDVGAQRRDSAFIINTGDFPAGIFYAQIEGDQSGVYTLGTISTQMLAPGKRDTVSVVFHPSSAGSYHSAIVFQFSESSLPLDSIILEGFAGATGVDAGGPETPLLVENFPDPFSASTMVRVSGIVDGRQISAELYDAIGRRVVDLTRDALTNIRNGVLSATLDGAVLPAGVYVLRVVAGKSIVVKTVRKM